MLNLLLDYVPTWAWLVLAAIALLAAWRFLGLRGMLAALGAIVTLGAYRAGHKSGNENALARQKKADEKAVKDYEKINSETDHMSDAELDAANSPWVRKPKQ